MVYMMRCSDSYVHAFHTSIPYPAIVKQFGLIRRMTYNLLTFSVPDFLQRALACRKWNRGEFSDSQGVGITRAATRFGYPWRDEIQG